MYANKQRRKKFNGQNAKVERCKREDNKLKHKTMKKHTNILKKTYKCWEGDTSQRTYNWRSTRFQRTGFQMQTITMSMKVKIKKF